MILEAMLSNLGERGAIQADVAKVISRLAQAAISVRGIINDGALGAAFSGKRHARDGGDTQYNLDVHTDELFLSAMHKCPLALYATEELDRPVRLDSKARLAIAIDPLDGSSNIDTNVSIGTIFSILETVPDADGLPDAEATFRQPGSAQLAAGFFIYGPQLALAVSWGDGLRIFVYSARKDAFVQIEAHGSIPRKANEFAINASNYRHWDEPTRLYIDDCLQGATGPREKDYNMRWIAALVADCYRILIRGGVYLYPADARSGYRRVSPCLRCAERGRGGEAAPTQGARCQAFRADGRAGGNDRALLRCVG